MIIGEKHLMEMLIKSGVFLFLSKMYNEKTCKKKSIEKHRAFMLILLYKTGETEIKLCTLYNVKNCTKEKGRF